MNPSEAALFALLRQRYAPPEWALLSQVADQTGGARRTADAIAMNLWRSRGYALHAFEFKATRSDLYREIKTPDKAERVGRYCDYFWIVAANEHVIGGDREIPEPWGVLVAKDDKLKRVRDAAKIEAVPIGRQFLAAVMRQVQAQLTDEATLAEEREKGYRDGVEAGRSGSSWEYERCQQEFAALTEQVKAFEDASGIHLTQWTDGAKIGEAVKIICQMRDLGRYGSVANSLRRAERLSGECAAALEAATAELAECLDLPSAEEHEAETRAAFERAAGKVAS